jgi:hypothetical protein
MMVCAYNSPSYPALVAYNESDGSVKWMSPLTDLPGSASRATAGLLLAKIGINGTPPRHWTFAANPAEFDAYAVNGTRVWKRANTAITPAAPDGVGTPISMSMNDAKELVTVTNKGWIVKLNPLNGSTIDAYKMDTNVVVNGTTYQGTFVTSNSPAVIGSTLYLSVVFQADSSNPYPYPNLLPVYVVRIELNQPGVTGMENKIKPLIRPMSPTDPTPDRVAIGVHNAGGSPPAWTAPDGKVVIFAGAYTYANGQLWPAIAGVQDDQGTLTLRWRSVLNQVPNDSIGAAPAFHALSRTLLVGTKNRLYVFRNVDTLAGTIPSPSPLPIEDVLSCGMDGGTATVTLGSPFGISYNRGTHEIVAYTNFQVTPTPSSPVYGYLGAFALPAEGPVIGRPVWCYPLAVTDTGAAAPGKGTAGQPALFRYTAGTVQTTGLIVNTVSTGTYIFRSMVSSSMDPSGLFNAVSQTPAAASLISRGFQVTPGSIQWPPCGDNPNCVGANPITQYGYAILPSAAGSRLFSLNGDDAFVVFGFAPPAITYYSFEPFQYLKFNPQTGQYFATYSNIGLGLNQLTINTLGGPNDQPFALIVASDHTLAYTVHKALLEAGVPEGMISHLLIPSQFANNGQPDPDMLAFLIRLTYRTPQEEQLITNYINQTPPPMGLIFFGGLGSTGNVMDSDLPEWGDFERLDSSELNAGVGADLDILVNQVIATYQAQGYTLKNTGAESLSVYDPQRDCRDVYQNCFIASPDAAYAYFYCPPGSQSLCGITLSNSTDFVIIAGVDHHRYAGDTLATYFMHTAFTKYRGTISPMLDLDMEGSATQYLGGTGVDPTNLYAVKLSRSCNGSPYCVELPSGTGGVPLSSPFTVTSRIYLDKVTGTAPNPADFVPAKLLWFGK